MTFSTQCTFTSHVFLIHFISHTLVSEDKQNIDSKLSSDLRHPNLYVFLVFIVCCEKRLNIVLTNYIINATMNYTYHIYLSTVLPLNTQLYVCQSVEHLIGRVGAPVISLTYHKFVCGTKWIEAYLSLIMRSDLTGYLN